MWGSYYVYYIYTQSHMGDYQNYGHFLDPYFNTGPNTGPNLGNPKKDHNFDNPPYFIYLRGTIGFRAEPEASYKLVLIP